MTEPIIGADGRLRCGVFAMAFALVAYAPYYIDTLRWRARPQRSSWFIWSVLSSVSCASQIAEGASTTLLFVVIQCAGTVGIFLLARSRGIGGIVDRRDLPVLGMASVGLLLRWITDDPAWAIYISCGISFLGGTLTIRKAYVNPQSETLPFWIISMIGACFALGAVGAWDPALMVYPAYLFCIKGAVLIAILPGRRRRATTRTTLAPA